MKTPNYWTIALIWMTIAMLLNGCEQTVSISTTVHTDGSLDRVVVLHESDSSAATENMLGISEETGWDVTLEPDLKSTETDNKPDVNVTFRKHFASVEDANREMDSGNDTLFHIASTFKKQNRWFYTYLEYRDTYRSLNRFTTLPEKEYFTEEDFAFIDRLPAEGKPITKADSIYLSRLDEKIFDLYGARSIFEEFYTHLQESMREHNAPSNWEDTLTAKKEAVFQRFVADGGEDGLLSLFDGLKIPFPPAVRESVQQKAAEIEKRTNFISTAYSGEYVHSVTLPWAVVESNADSVAGNTLLWYPPVIKFLLNDYTMSATSRKMNLWAVVVSAVIVCITLWLFLRRGSSTP